MGFAMAPALKSDFDREHPVAAWIGIAAVVVAILLILWARIEVHGTHDLEQTLSSGARESQASKPKPSPDADRGGKPADVHEAVAAGRWAAGFAP